MKTLITFMSLMAFTIHIALSQNQQERIEVLNMGTFHFGPTNDASSTEFDEHSDENLKAAHEIARSIAKAKPTILAVEQTPETQETLRRYYQEYLDNPSAPLKFYGEISMLVFEVGRLAGIPADKLFCIDHKLNYQYRFDETDRNTIDKALYKAYTSNYQSFHPEIRLNYDGMSLREILYQGNTDAYLDFLIHVNADQLALYGTEEDPFMGADQAALYYQRNLRMYANFNAIPAETNDRIFVLMGGSHTAYFRDFISRSIKYQSVEVLPYLEAEAAH